jgi:hypothetical protein
MWRHSRPVKEAMRRREFVVALGAVADLRTAKAPGPVVPQLLLAQADEVIE